MTALFLAVDFFLARFLEAFLAAAFRLALFLALVRAAFLAAVLRFASEIRMIKNSKSLSKNYVSHKFLFP